MRSRTLLAVGLIGLVGLVGAACSSDDDSSTVGAGAEAGAHNDADVTFAQSMIPHHRQAVEMAKLAADRAEDQRVLDLASKIEDAQGPEIDEMTAWLNDWDEDVPATGGHEAMTGMSGMMSAEDMDALEGASGTDFDRMFLTMMIEHHQGAVDMANTELDDGQSTDALALARKIIAAQEAEIAEMQGILGESSAGTSTTAPTMGGDG